MRRRHDKGAAAHTGRPMSDKRLQKLVNKIFKDQQRLDQGPQDSEFPSSADSDESTTSDSDATTDSHRTHASTSQSQGAEHEYQHEYNDGLDYEQDPAPRPERIEEIDPVFSSPSKWTIARQTAARPSHPCPVVPLDVEPQIIEKIDPTQSPLQSNTTPDVNVLSDVMATSWPSPTSFTRSGR